MNPRDKHSGETLTIVVLVLSLLGVGVFAFKPSWLPGASRRAAKSTEATAAVKDATAAVDKAVRAQGAAAAAIGVEIGVANRLAPDSPSKSYIERDLTLLASLLPPPDQSAQLAAQARRIAVMEGNLDEARRLYESNSKEISRLQKEKAAAEAARAAADAARQAADLEVEKAAAADHARSMQMWVIGGIALLFLFGWIYRGMYSVGPEAIAKIKRNVLDGEDANVAIDTWLGPRMFKRIKERVKQLAPDHK